MKPPALESNDSDSERDKHRSENRSASRSSYDVSADTCISNGAATVDDSDGGDGSQVSDDVLYLLPDGAVTESLILQEAGSDSQPVLPMQDLSGEPEDDYDREDDPDYEQDQDEGEDDEGEEEEASNGSDGNRRRKLSKVRPFSSQRIVIT